MAGFTPPERVIAYIDGFNTYHGMRSKAWRRYLWLDYTTLLTRLLKGSQQLVEVNYFTAIVNRPADSAARHKTYLRALDVTGGVRIHLGLYTEDDFRCLGCGTWGTAPSENKPTSTWRAG